MSRPDPSASAMTAAASPEWVTRAQAAQQLAPWADRDDIATVLYRLILDTGDTVVTETACTALLERGDIHGIRLVARAIANTEHPRVPEYSDHIDHLYSAVSSHRLPDGPIHEFLDTCNALTHDQDTEVAAGAAKLLQWARPWA